MKKKAKKKKMSEFDRIKKALKMLSQGAEKAEHRVVLFSTKSLSVEVEQDGWYYLRIYNNYNWKNYVIVNENDIHLLADALHKFVERI